MTPFAISGLVNCPPLASVEAVEVTGLPILEREVLLWSPKAIARRAAVILRARTPPVAA